MLISIGDKIRDYQIISQIGEGGMGQVYLADDLMLERKVAIKMLDPLLTKEAQFKARFKNEAKVQASLFHPNIVALHNFFEESGNLFMVMEYAEGITLKELISQIGPVPEERSIRIFIQLLEGVNVAHKRGIIHRDLKPSNVIIDKNDNVKIMDFGIAKLLGKKGLTKSGTNVGTVYYMSPEQVQGEEEIDQRTDIYSLGVTFYQMLTGKLPYDIGTDSDFAVMEEIVRGEIEDPRNIYPYISENNIKVLYKMLEKDRDERYGTVIECIKDLGNKVEQELGRIHVPKVEESEFTNVENTVNPITEEPEGPKVEEPLIQKVEEPNVTIEDESEVKKVDVTEENKISETEQLNIEEERGIEELPVKTVKALKERNIKPKYIIAIATLIIISISVYYFINKNSLKKNDTTVQSKPITQDINAKSQIQNALKNMILVKGGWFEMGNSAGASDEKPVHRVFLDDFYISKYEVTVAEYKEFCESTGRVLASAPDWGWQDKHPIVNVNWNDAKTYCEWRGGRLPTEAEWEFAARGGLKHKGYKYSGGNNVEEVAWYSANSLSSTQVAGTKRANELGLYDMSGNVWEWCIDDYDRGYYKASPERNPISSNGGKERVIRGGSWVYFTNYQRSWDRKSLNSDSTSYDVRFRFAISVK